MSSSTTDLPDIPEFLRRAPTAPATFAKPLILTYTILNTYLICPHQMMRRYIAKDLKFVETREMKWGNEVHEAMEKRMGGKPLPVHMQQWDRFPAAYSRFPYKAEWQLAVDARGQPTDYWGKDVFFRGKVDVVLTMADKGMILDWKTGKSREEPFELETGAMLVRSRMVLSSIQASYVWLKEDRIGQAHDVSDVASTWARINNLAEEIRDCQADNYWHKKQGPLCKWCNVFDCENNTNPDKP